jgi:hypothetical protein
VNPLATLLDLLRALRWIALAAVVGVIVGTACALFLVARSAGRASAART